MYGKRQLLSAVALFIFTFSSLISPALAEDAITLVRVCDPKTGICCYAAQAAPRAASVATQTTRASLDLASTNRNVMTSTGFAPTVIQTAAGAKTISPSSMVTPAEFVALQQALTTGAQTLVIGVDGNATGGTFN